ANEQALVANEWVNDERGTAGLKTDEGATVDDAVRLSLPRPVCLRDQRLHIDSTNRWRRACARIHRDDLHGLRSPHMSQDRIDEELQCLRVRQRRGGLLKRDGEFCAHATGLMQSMEVNHAPPGIRLSS